MSTSIASSGEDSIRKTLQVATHTDLDGRDIDEIFEVDHCVKWIADNGVSRVALQFPNELLQFAAQVVMKIAKLIEPARAYVLADSTYGSCCVDEKTAAHMNADSLIHFGHYCGSCKNIKMPVLYVLVRPKVDVEKLTMDFIATYPNPSDDMGILYDYEYEDAAKKLQEILMDRSYTGVSLIDPKMLEKLQENHDERLVMPGKCFYLTSTESAIINRIVQANKIFSMDHKAGDGSCEISIYDPTCSTKIATPSIHKLLMKRNYYIEKIREAGTIGILVGTLSMDNYLEVIKHLKEIIRRFGRRCFVVSIGEINAPKLANFPDINAFVLVACPEATLIESKEFYQVVVTPWEIEIAFGRENLTADYFVDYRVLLPGSKEHVPFENFEATSCADVSLLNGASRIDLNWQGLEEKVENEDNLMKVHEGQSGIARHYTSEPVV